jgi:hypothetical protein
MDRRDFLRKFVIFSMFSLGGGRCSIPTTESEGSAGAGVDPDAIPLYGVLPTLDPDVAVTVTVYETEPVIVP